MPLVWQQYKYREKWTEPSHGSSVWRNVPWFQKMYRMNKKTQAAFCWAATTILQAETKTIKKIGNEMVGLIDACSPEVYKLIANKRPDISPISAESWNEHHQQVPPL